MNGTTVELDFGYVLGLLQGFGTNWVALLAAYLVMTVALGVKFLRAPVAEKLERRAEGKESSTDCPPELMAVTGFFSAPVWVPFYILFHVIWFAVAYPANKQVEEDEE